MTRASVYPHWNSVHPPDRNPSP